MRFNTGRFNTSSGASQALFVLPLFFIYQFGILTSRVRNGADLITEWLVRLCAYNFSHYLLVLCLSLVAYVGLILYLRERGQIELGRAVPLLLEAGIYALLMGTLISLVMTPFVGLTLQELRTHPRGTGSGTGHIGIVAMSAGAGLHEELLFRLIGVGGGARLLSFFFRPWAAVAGAIVASSLIFSAMHHVGPLGEPFTVGAFIYRSLAGVYFALIFRWRGFAVAAWTHALYDLYFLTFVA